MNKLFISIPSKHKTFSQLFKKFWKGYIFVMLSNNVIITFYFLTKIFSKGVTMVRLFITAKAGFNAVCKCFLNVQHWLMYLKHWYYVLLTFWKMFAKCKSMVRLFITSILCFNNVCKCLQNVRDWLNTQTVLLRLTDVFENVS